jgi:hypothetical protein
LVVSIGSDGVLGVVFTAGERPRRSPTNTGMVSTCQSGGRIVQFPNHEG